MVDDALYKSFLLLYVLYKSFINIVVRPVQISFIIVTVVCPVEISIIVVVRPVQISFIFVVCLGLCDAGQQHLGENCDLQAGGGGAQRERRLHRGNTNS